MHECERASAGGSLEGRPASLSDAILPSLAIMDSTTPLYTAACSAVREASWSDTTCTTTTSTDVPPSAERHCLNPLCRCKNCRPALVA